MSMILILTHEFHDSFHHAVAFRQRSKFEIASCAIFLQIEDSDDRFNEFDVSYPFLAQQVVFRQNVSMRNKDVGVHQINRRKQVGVMQVWVELRSFEIEMLVCYYLSLWLWGENGRVQVNRPENLGGMRQIK